MARQLFYSRPQVARLCGVRPRTVIRWEGVFLTKLKDPSDPSGRRVMYEGTEVENLLRRRYRHENDSAHATKRQRKRRRAPAKKSEKAGNAAKRRAPVSRDRAAERPAAPSQSEPARESSKTGPPSSQRRARDEADRALERWNREIDERKRRWDEEHPEEAPPKVPDNKKTRR